MDPTNLRLFEEWLRVEGKSANTVAFYAGKVKAALHALGVENLTKQNLDAYAAGLPQTQRNLFRSAWRQFVRFGVSRGVEVENVSAGRLGPPPRLLPWQSRLEDFAIAYLVQSIAIERFGDLRWTDVEWTSPIAAVITDPPARKRYFVHRQALDVLLTWARPDRRPIAALVPDEPGGHGWMSQDEIEERIAAARKAAALVSFPQPIAAFLSGLPPPRVESVDPTPRAV